MLDEELLLIIAVMIRRGNLSNRQRALLLILLYFLMQRRRNRYDSDSSSSSSDEEELHILPASQNQNKKRQAEEASASSAGSPALSLGPGELDIVDTHIKEEDFSDTEGTPAKRLKTEPPDTSATHVDDSTSIQPVKTEPLDKQLGEITSVRDASEPPEPHHFSAVKQEPLDIPEFVDPLSVNSSLPGTSGVTVKSEPEDTGGSSSVTFCEVFIPEETDTRIKQEFELPPDDL